MTRNAILSLAGAAALVLGMAATAQADGGGGGGGGGGDDRWSQPQSYRPVAPAGRPMAAPGPVVRDRAYAESTLPDGTKVRSRGVGRGGRFVRTTTPDGVARAGFRPAGQKADQPGARSRTTYDPNTRITSTWTTNADGSVTGVHVDDRGSRAVSNSRPAPRPAL